MLKLILIIGCLLNTLNIYSQDKTEAYFQQYFINNIDILNFIDGIYDVDLSTEGPFGYDCRNCIYPIKNYDNYDKVAVYSEKGEVVMYSIKYQTVVGVFERQLEETPLDKNNRWNTKYNKYRFVARGTGYFSEQAGKFSVWNKKFFQINKKQNEILNSVRKPYANELKVNCTTPSDICSGYNDFGDAITLTYTFKKSFPNQFTKPISTSSVGTGFLVDKDGLIMTNYHVITVKPKLVWDENVSMYLPEYNSNVMLEADTVTVTFPGLYKSYKAIVLFTWQPSDIAILKLLDYRYVPNISPEPIPFDTSSIEIGCTVSTLGYPLSTSIGNNIKLTKGFISSTTGIDGSLKHFTLDIGINPGNSGGPLFNDSTLCCIGVVNARLNDASLGTKTENIGYAVRMNYLITWLDGKYLGEVNDPSNQLNISYCRAKKPGTKISQLTNSVVIVKTE